MEPSEIKSHNERVDRLNQKLDRLEELVIDELIRGIEGTVEPTREVITMLSTAAGVLKANKRSIPPNLPNPHGDPLAGLVDDPDELPTNFMGDRR